MAQTRRLFDQGNSVVMVLTRDVLRHLGCHVGDEVQVHKEPRHRITIRKFHAGKLTGPPRELPMERRRRMSFPSG